MQLPTIVLVVFRLMSLTVTYYCVIKYVVILFVFYLIYAFYHIISRDKYISVQTLTHLSKMGNDIPME